MIVLAGIEANRFLMRDAALHLHTHPMFKAFAGELGTQTFLVAMDGDEHRHLRRQLKGGYARIPFADRLSEMVSLTVQEIERWDPDRGVPILEAMQRIVADQLGSVLVHRAHGENVDCARRFGRAIFRVHVVRSRPAFFLRRPAYRKDRRQMMQRGRELVAWHRANPPGDRAPDLVDHLLDARDEAGQPLSEDAILAGTVDAHLVGIDTVASTCAFLFNLLARHPEAHERLTAEVRAGQDGGPTDFRSMPGLHTACVEAMRLYPVAPVSPRLVGEPFDFGGYHFHSGLEVLIANGVTHYLPEFFPDPERFDIDRELNFGRHPGAYAPYTLGEHLCLGAGLAELQIATIASTVLRKIRFDPVPPRDRIVVYTSPVPNPGYRCRLRFTRLEAAKKL